MRANPERNFFCSRLSLQSSEQLFGTASRVEVWFLLEVPRSWADRSFAGSRLPEAVKEQFAHYLRSIPHSRLLFIRQPPRATPPFRFYLARSKASRPRLHEFQLDRYEDLLALDIPALLSGHDDRPGSVCADPLIAVCTHGTHDPCCAKFGLPVYRELTHQLAASSGLERGITVWQCSHVGGDRFAANVLCFPHGVYYGQLAVSEVATVIEAARRGQVYLEKYRGRSCYGFTVQAAEYFLMARTGARELAQFRLLENQRVAENTRRVRFLASADGTVHSIELAREAAGFKNYLSCKAQQESNVMHYRLIRHTVE